VNAAFRALAVGACAVVITLPCRANFLGDFLNHAVGVNANLVGQVTGVVHAQPSTVQVPTRPVVPPPEHTIAVVTAEDRARLLQSIGDLSQSSAQNAHKSASIVLSLVIGTILLGVFASIAAFCKASVLAGILSILATTTVGANNTLPFRDDADTYKFVSAQASALLLAANLETQMTQDQYNDYRNRLVKLATYGDDKSATGSTEALTKLLQQLHST
jgi:hypothetical protein